MNAGQRTAAGEHIFDHRRECGELRAIADDSHFAGHAPRQLDRSRQQRAPLQFDERLIGAHARALAARENECR